MVENERRTNHFVGFLCFFICFYVDPAPGNRGVRARLDQGSWVPASQSRRLQGENQKCRNQSKPGTLLYAVHFTDFIAQKVLICD